jgi:ATP-dependent Clp protease ATP-binding subunit ClpB
VLDDGRLTDSQGRVVDFRNTIIILTSNLGSSVILEGIDGDGQIAPEARAEVQMLLRRQFRPEFLNRLDETVFYKPLTKAEIGHIVELMIGGLRRRLQEQQLTVELSEDAKAYIIEEGFDPVYGARPLRRFLQQKVETLLAREIIGGGLNPGDCIRVGFGPHGLQAEVVRSSCD